MDAPTDLSADLRPILDYEIGRGNQVVRIDRPAGTNCPLAVIFVRPLDFAGYKQLNEGLPSIVRTWQNRDQHYPVEDGYFCERTGQALAGPAKGS